MVTTDERQQALHHAEVPDGLVRRLAEPLGSTAALDALRGWVDRWRRGDREFAPTVLLAGGVGTGKTLAAAWALAENWETCRPYLRERGDLPEVRRWRSGYFSSLERLTNRSLFQDDDRLARQRAVDTSLLVLDDVGTERGDGEAALRDLLSTRMAARRRTILTTNLGAAAFAARYRERLMSRIRGEGLVVECGQRDLRLTGADLAAGVEQS